ncbi:hypothetical protein BGZ60DRAFT_530160 [Tricladium varicosporioides]|nr:hypothetical protein BGZ60DRAFT_530160 [Hymenoscyphus varicosporioides]
MQFPKILTALFATTALARPSQSAPRDDATAIFDRAVNNGRPVATGACCIANTSKKGDTCTNAAGAPGVCQPANTANCGAKLTCT